MDESRILIVGAYGQLGKALQAQYPGAIAVDRDSPVAPEISLQGMPPPALAVHVLWSRCQVQRRELES